MMNIKTVGLASDHAAFPLKQFVKQYLDWPATTQPFRSSSL